MPRASCNYFTTMVGVACVKRADVIREREGKVLSMPAGESEYLTAIRLSSSSIPRCHICADDPVTKGHVT